MSLIHPTAIVEDGARLGADVTVGAFSIVGNQVTLEDGVTLDAHVMIRGRTTIGARTRVATLAVLGGEAQDLSYKGEDTALVIGPDCVIREQVTINRGTARGRGTTVIGAHSFIMTGAHVAHDCVLGEHVILTNLATLGGHTEIGDHAILGGVVAVQQRTRIGAHSFIGGMSGVNRDVIPFAIATGRFVRLAGLNVVGLKRRGYDKDALHALHQAYRLFFTMQGPRAERLAAVAEQYGNVTAVAVLIDFIRASGNRPLALPRDPTVGTDDDYDGEDV
ncbi:MAG TPA: acyl-ACP--UDP-N-acetylglucosamine O-acyltransferase [Bauldia sp.]|nr:acyl-ACP--UDP-N-acetylglucosamine O-acyltransferase [Bauldia sp.]